MSTDQEDIEPRQIIIETRPDEYNMRLTDGWAKRFLDAGNSAPLLAAPVFSLAAELRAIAISASLPYTLVNGIVGFYRGMTEGAKDRDSARFVRVTRYRLCKALSENAGANALTQEQLSILNSEALRIERDLANVESHDFCEDVGNNCWNTFMDEKGFKFGAWGAQRQAFVGIYNAYESFVVASIKAAGNLASFRDKRISTALEHYFGNDVVLPCWKHEELHVGRLVRHAISHAEGKETNDLRGVIHGIRVTGTERLLNVFPEDVRRLLRRVESASMSLVQSRKSPPDATSG